jgi:hypothetical protein
MGKINLGRVVMGGLLAGVLLNVVDFLVHGMWLMDDYTAAMEALGQEPMPTSMMGWFVILDFIYGIFLVWLYAAIRPRFGAGPQTAVYAGLAGWFVAALMHTLFEAPMGLYPMSLWVIGTVVALIQMPAATVLGAWLYQEEG